MTCEELHEIVDTISPWDTTRAIRAAIIKHIGECKPCEDYVMVGRRPVSEQNAAKLALTLANDIKDREYRETTRFGEKPWPAAKRDID